MNNLIFNKEQEQILLGSLLGDGCISHKKNYIYIEGHSIKQKEYLLWKNSFLNFNYHFYPKSKNGVHNQLCKSDLIFKQYYNLFYPNNKKIITREILDKLEPLGLTVWYLDDGSYNYQNKGIIISTNCFNLEGNQIIQQYFKERWNIECKIQRRELHKDERYIFGKKIKNFNRIDYLLRFNVENTKKFIELIKSYVIQIPSMTYKIGLDENRKSEFDKRGKEYRKSMKEHFKSYHLKNDKNYYLKNRDKILQKKKEYLIQWRIKNPNFTQSYNKLYYKENKEKIIEANKEYYLINKEKLLKQKKEYYLINKESICSRVKNYYLNNKDKILLKLREKNKQKLGGVGLELL